MGRGCVEERDKLKAEIERLREENERMREFVDKWGCFNLDDIYKDAERYHQRISALEAEIERLEDQIKQMRSVIAFYANPEVYCPDSMGCFVDLLGYAEKSLAAIDAAREKTK